MTSKKVSKDKPKVPVIDGGTFGNREAVSPPVDGGTFEVSDAGKPFTGPFVDGGTF